jgi:hypothetical protein
MRTTTGGWVSLGTQAWVWAPDVVGVYAFAEGDQHRLALDPWAEPRPEATLVLRSGQLIPAYITPAAAVARLRKGVAGGD